MKEKEGLASATGSLEGTGPSPRARDLNLDLIRALAGLLVVAVHFVMMIEFYYQPMIGGRMLFTAIARMGFMTCVPLFLLLTGYLCGSKELSGRYYLGLYRVLLTYALCSVVSLLFRWRWLGEEMTLRHGLKLTLNYTGAANGWYIEMYIGLFLLIPFLNAMWRGLTTKRARLALVVTMLALTTLPTLTNLQLSGTQYQILPAWWRGIFPLTYYVLGLWLRTEELRVDPRWALPALLASVAAGGVGAYALSGGGAFTSEEITGWAGPTVVLSACLLFLLLRQLPLGKTPGWLAALIRKGSELSLGIYLVSWCFDNAYYPKLWAAQPVFAKRLPWFFVMVPAVYLSSAVVAQAVEWARKGVTWCVNRAFPKLKLK